jgi:hypothetical protein
MDSLGKSVGLQRPLDDLSYHQRIVAWIRIHCHGQWEWFDARTSRGLVRFYTFVDARDATLFKLTWSGEPDDI